MWDHEIKAMASSHSIIAASVFMATVLPAVLVPGFSVYGTHLLWLYSVSAAVAAVSVSVFWLLGISPPTKKHTLGYKVTQSMCGSNVQFKCVKVTCKFSFLNTFVANVNVLIFIQRATYLLRKSENIRMNL